MMSRAGRPTIGAHAVEGVPARATPTDTPRRAIRTRGRVAEGDRPVLLLRERGAPGVAKVAELVDALDLGSSGFGRGGSSPPFRICQFALARVVRGNPVVLPPL